MGYSNQENGKLLGRRGQTAIFLSLTIVVFLAFAGVAIDEASIYLTKLNLQAACDAASISGLTALVNDLSQGTLSHDDSISDAQAKASEIVIQNLRHMNLDDSLAPQVEATTNALNIVGPNPPIIMRFTVTEQRNVHTLLIGMFIPGQRNVPVVAQGVAVRKPSITSLVLDFCDGTTGHGKIAAVKAAVNAYLDSAPSNIDELALVTFCQSATVAFPMGVLSADRKTAIKDAMDIAAANSGPEARNTSEAIAFAQLQITGFVSALPAGATADSVKSIILVTSGSPRVLRGGFLNPTDEATLPESPPGSGLYNYYADRVADALQDDPLSEHPVTCSPIAACLNDFRYHDSTNVNTQGFLDATNAEEIKKEMYDLAIIEADRAKNFQIASRGGIAIYVIGKNPVDGESASITDGAYQDLNITAILKPIFLRRLANVNPNSDPPFEVGGAGYIDDQPEGIYLSNPTDDQVRNFVRQLNSRAKIRLISGSYS